MGTVGGVEPRYATLAYQLNEKGKGVGTFGAVCLWADALTFSPWDRLRLLGQVTWKVPSRYRPRDPGDQRITLLLRYADVDHVYRDSKVGHDSMIEQVFVVLRWGQKLCFANGSRTQGVVGLFTELAEGLEAAGHRVTVVGQRLYVDRVPDTDEQALVAKADDRRRVRRFLAGAVLTVVGVAAAGVAVYLDEDADADREAERDAALWAAGDCIVVGPTLGFTRAACDNLADRKLADRKVFRVFHVVPATVDDEVADKECMQHVPAADRADGEWSFSEFHSSAGTTLCAQRLRPPPPG